MKTILKKITRSLVIGLVAFGALRAEAQNRILVDAAQPWAGYMNVFNLPDYSGGFVFGSPWGTPDLVAVFTNGLVLRPAITAGPRGWNSSDPAWNGDDNFWVNTNTVPITGNKFMEANFYVDTASLVGSNMTFSGNVIERRLASGYTSRAFIKVFPADYSSVLQEAYAPLTNDNQFFSINLEATAAGAAHVQYGFVTTGPNAQPGSMEANSYILIRTNAVNPLNLLVNPGFESDLTGWTAYGNGGNTESQGNLYFNGGVAEGASNVLVYAGQKVQKVYGQFSGGENFSGVYQDIPTGPGSVWSATGKSLSHTQDRIGEGNEFWVEVTFRDAANTTLATYQSQILNNASPANTWLDMRVTNSVEGGLQFTAPPGTTKVRLQSVYRQPTFGGGSVYSDNMELNNLSPSDPNITTLPASQTKLVGQTATFNVVATGNTALSYQWKTNGVDLVNGSKFSGVNTATLTINNVQKSDIATYTVTVSNQAGTLDASASLNVKTPAEAANCLENPGFESGVYSPWVKFNGGGLKTTNDFYAFDPNFPVNIFEGNYVSQVTDGGEFNGAYQDVPASPGQIFTADGWFYVPSQEGIFGQTTAWLEVQFRAGGTPLALYKSTVLTNTTVTDTWINLQATNGFAGDFVTPIPNAKFLVAPEGTTTVRYQVTLKVAGGSAWVYYDDMKLLKKLPVSVSTSRSGGNLLISWLSQGATSYQVVYKDNLTDSSWTPVGGLVSGTGSVVTAPPIPTSNTQRFYSVLTQ